MHPETQPLVVVSVADQVVVFAISLLLGALAIYVAARYVHDSSDYGNAVLTALIGAIVWGLLSWVPVVGTLLALVAWIAVINWRYPGGWMKAAIVGVAAWAVAVVVLSALALAGIGSFEAIGVPGT